MLFSICWSIGRHSKHSVDKFIATTLYGVAGTENAADEENRQRIAVEPETGGSYVVG